jgi:hypothetical protein
MVEVLGPLCQGIGGEPKLCAAIVLGMSSAFVEAFETNAGDFDYRVFVELCKYVYPDPEKHLVVEAMGAIAVADEDVMEKHLLMAAMRLGFYSESELREYRAAKKTLSKYKNQLINRRMNGNAVSISSVQYKLEKQSKQLGQTRAAARWNAAGKTVREEVTEKKYFNEYGRPFSGLMRAVGAANLGYEEQKKVAALEEMVEAIESRVCLLRCTIGVGKQDKLVLEELLLTMDLEAGKVSTIYL